MFVRENGKLFLDDNSTFVKVMRFLVFGSEPKEKLSPQEQENKDWFGVKKDFTALQGEYSAEFAKYKDKGVTAEVKLYDTAAVPDLYEPGVGHNIKITIDGATEQQLNKLAKAIPHDTVNIDVAKGTITTQKQTLADHDGSDRGDINNLKATHKAFSKALGNVRTALAEVISEKQQPVYEIDANDAKLLADRLAQKPPARSSTDSLER